MDELLLVASKMATGGSYMSLPISNSLGVQMCMTSDWPSGAAFTPAVPPPAQSQYGTQYGSLARSRPRSGLSISTTQLIYE